MTVVAFLGPSLSPAPRGFRVLPPAQRGDVWRALKTKPEAIALVDGVFESRPSVWHHEILDALDAGVHVFGGASMGALRAAELHGFGMVGVGRIFRWYRDEELIDDSEVALLHADREHGYRPLTVPLVNVRWAASQLLPRKQAGRVIDACGRIFYQDRTWPRVLEHVPPRLHEKFRALDLKADDARLVLEAAAAAKVPRAPHPRWPPPSSLVRRMRDPRPPRDLRRALLAGWAREWGLDPHASDTALEKLVLEHADRMLNDGI